MRFASHLVQNGALKCVSRVIWFRTELQSAFRESFDSERRFKACFASHLVQNGASKRVSRVICQFEKKSKLYQFSSRNIIVLRARARVCVCVCVCVYGSGFCKVSARFRCAEEARDFVLQGHIFQSIPIKLQTWVIFIRLTMQPNNTITTS